jgi:hypothetical protein
MKVFGMKIPWVLLGALSLLFVFPSAGFAATLTNSPPGATQKAPPPGAPKKARGFPFHGNVAAIDKTSITMEGKMHRVFHVTSETKINRNKIASKLEALAVGDYVGGFAREAPDGKLELVTLNITPQSPSAKSKTSAAK